MFSFVFSVKEKMKVLDTLLLEVCVFWDFSHGAPLLDHMFNSRYLSSFLFWTWTETAKIYQLATIIIFASYMLCHIPYLVGLERDVSSGHAVLVLELGLHIVGVLLATAWPDIPKFRDKRFCCFFKNMCFKILTRLHPPSRDPVFLKHSSQILTMSMPFEPTATCQLLYLYVKNMKGS